MENAMVLSTNSSSFPSIRTFPSFSLWRMLWFFRRTAALFHQFARFRHFFDFVQIEGILKSDKL